MTRIMTLLLIVHACWLSVAGAEEQALDPGMDAMRGIASLVGRWEGDGWMRRGPGEPHTFTSLEMVESRLDGRVLIVEGIHHGGGGEAVHHALATISYDPDAGHYRFRSYLANGQAGDHRGHLDEDGVFRWEIEMPRGQVRYTIRIEDDEWHEVGHFSADGETWDPFFQMDLKRVAGE
jgi:hypothetical protein